MRVHELKRYGLKVTIASLKSGRGLVEIALGSEVRTLSLSDFCQRVEEIGAEAVTHQQALTNAICWLR